ncbi:MAG: DNA internalization-related competence protein ComEC/Rec2 [Vicinamibacterales bacterium]
MTLPAIWPLVATLGGIAWGLLWPFEASLMWPIVGGGWIAGSCAALSGEPEMRRWCVRLALMATASLWTSHVAHARLVEPLAVWRSTDDASSGEPVEPLCSAPCVIGGRLARDAVTGARGVVLRVVVDRIDDRPVMPTAVAQLAVQGDLASMRRELWRRGRAVRVVAALRPATYLANPGVDETWSRLAAEAQIVGSVKSAALVDVVHAGGAWEEAAASARAWARRRLAAHFVDDPLAGALTTAILIGDRAGIGPDVESHLQRAGVYHVIAISGGNLALVVATSLALGRLLRLPVRPLTALTGAIVSGYAGITGAEPSVARATLMALALLMARALDIPSTGVNVLASTVLVLLWLDPLTVLDVATWLTAMATLGILVFAGRWPALVASTGIRAGRWGWAWAGFGALVGLAGASVAAEAWVWPIAARAFSQVTIVGLVANFAAVPLMSLVQVSGGLVLAFDALGLPVGHACAWVAGVAAHALVSSATSIETALPLVFAVRAPPLWTIPAYYAALWAFCRRGGGVPAARVVVAGALIVFAPSTGFGVGPCGSAPPWPARETLHVTFLDVGQGDCALVRWPDGRALIIDAGGAPGSDFDVGARVVTPAVLAMGVRRLSYALTTHADPDHAGGLPSVVRALGPFEVWEGVPVATHQLRAQLRATAEASGAAWRMVQGGDHLDIGNVALDVRHPPLADWDRRRVRNDDSVVLELRYGDVSVVFTGDVSSDVEALLVERLSRAPLRVLKVGHHGSRTSTSQAFVDALRPDVAVASLGRRNPFGHPAGEVVARLRASGALFLETDLAGAVDVATDGHVLWVTTCRGTTVMRRARPL